MQQWPGDTAWFVPEIKDEKRIPSDGQFGGTRTRDGGKSFDILRKGLPKEPSCFPGQTGSINSQAAVSPN